MKAKAGFGNSTPIALLQLLQSLQSQLISLFRKFFLKKYFFSKENSWDWSDWSDWSEWIRTESARDLNKERNLLPPEEFQVSKHAIKRWLEDSQANAPWSGDVCMCGHPMALHQFGIQCLIGPRICTCVSPKAILRVSDLRYFYNASKGPHEAHALIRGNRALEERAGKSVQLLPWVCCIQGCTDGQFVGPVRLGDGRPTLRVVLNHEKNVLLCEDCLYRYSNGRKSLLGHQRTY